MRKTSSTSATTGQRGLRATALAIVAATGLALTGCASVNAVGGDSGEAAAPDLVKVSVAYSSPGASYSDLYVADAEGIFVKNGLDVDLRTLNSSSQVIPAILSGSVDIAIGAPNNTAAAIMKGSELTIIGVTRSVFNLEVYADKSIKSVEDLKGKKVGITSPGSQSDQALTAMLEKNGMTREDVIPTFVKSIPGQLAALRSGSVSAILAQPPQGVEAIKAGFPVLVRLSDIPFPSAAIAVTNSFLAEHPDVVDAFMKSEVEALKLLQSDKDATVRAIMKYSGVDDEDAADYAYDFFKEVWAVDPSIDESLIQRAFELASEETGDPVPADISAYIDSSFVDKQMK